MSVAFKPGWSKPSTILFASEIPVNEKTLSFALAQAAEFGAKLILFHAYDTVVVTTLKGSGIRTYDDAARFELEQLEPLAQRAREAGIECETVVRPGLPAEAIAAYAQEREEERAIDRIMVGTHSPGRVGKLLLGSVAEAVLRIARRPVCIIGSQVVSGRYRNFATRTILCAVSLMESSYIVASFAAELAVRYNARLVLQHVIRPQDRTEVLAGRSIDQIEGDLVALGVIVVHVHHPVWRAGVANLFHKSLNRGPPIDLPDGGVKLMGGTPPPRSNSPITTATGYTLTILQDWLDNSAISIKRRF